MANMYYREAAGAIVTFDLTSMESYEGAISWLREVSIAAPEDIAIALVGNLMQYSDDCFTTWYNQGPRLI